MNDPSPGMQCSGIRRSFGGGEGFRAHIQAAGKPTLATFLSCPSRAPSFRSCAPKQACQDVPPERMLSGDDVCRGGARTRPGAHLSDGPFSAGLSV